MSEETNDQRPTTRDLIALDVARTVTFSTPGATYTYTFPRLKPARWEHYFKAIEVTIEGDGKGGRVQKIDDESAYMDMVRSEVASVDGYAGEMMTRPRDDWRRYLPTGHVRLVAAALRDVVGVPAKEGPVDPLLLSVELEATWGGRRYTGLVHRFNPPSIEHERELNRARSEIVYVGGSLTQKNILPARHPVLMALYDKLVVAAEGYTVDGKPLEGRDHIVEFMDGYHKYMAASLLFAEPEASMAVQEEAPGK